jgi:hypothetical protein
MAFQGLPLVLNSGESNAYGPLGITRLCGALGSKAAPFPLAEAGRFGKEGLGFILPAGALQWVDSKTSVVA